MKEEEEHDEIVEEIVKKLVENDLYIKPEEYKWKVREIEFLRLVIGPEEIKIEEKVKGVLDWLTLKGAKAIQKILRLANYYQWFIKDLTSIARSLYDLVMKDRSGIGWRGRRKFKGKIYKRTSISSTRLRFKKNKDRSKCIGLYNKRSFVYGV